MANLKISGFTAASALDGTELLGGVQSSANAKITAAQIKTYCNTQGFIGGTSVQYPSVAAGVNTSGFPAAATLQTQNAAGLKCAFIGRLFIPNISVGTTKTLSTGSIAIKTGAVTFANGTTKLDVGLQGISTSAGPVIRPDDSFSVKTTLTGGVSTVNANAENSFTMTTGTASPANGSYIAVVLDMTARGGADSVIIQAAGGSGLILPCGQLFSAAAWGTAVTAATPIVRITFDDGTLGYIENGQSVSSATATETWADATNPDERGNIMQLPFTCTASGLWIVGGVTDASSTLTYNVFSDPTGTPTGLTGASGTFDPHQNAGTSGQDRFIPLPFSAPVVLTKNTDYCFAIRATGSTNIRLAPWTVSASANRTWFGNGTAGKTTRDGGSGVFAAASTTVGYFMGPMISQVITG